MAISQIVNTSEIEKLHTMLAEAKIPHDFYEHFGGYRIAYPRSRNYSISCIQIYGSHGIESGLIEALGLGCNTEPYTAEQLYKKIKKDYKTP